MVTALDETGTILWQSELGKSSDALKDASGGRLAVGGTQLFVTTGFGTVVALDTASGARALDAGSGKLWRRLSDCL